MLTQSKSYQLNRLEVHFLIFPVETVCGSLIFNAVTFTVARSYSFSVSSSLRLMMGLPRVLGSEMLNFTSDCSTLVWVFITTSSLLLYLLSVIWQLMGIPFSQKGSSCRLCFLSNPTNLIIESPSVNSPSKYFDCLIGDMDVTNAGTFACGSGDTISPGDNGPPLTFFAFGESGWREGDVKTSTRFDDLFNAICGQ